MTKYVYIFLCMIVSGIVIYYIKKSLNKRDEVSKSMTRIMCCGQFIIVCYALTLLTKSYFIMSLGNSIQFIMIDWILLLYILYGTTVTEGRDRRKYRYIVRIITFIVIIDSIIMAINPFKEIALTYTKRVVSGEVFYIYEPYVLYRCHLAICYFMVAVFTYILVRKCLEIPHFYRKRYIGVLSSLIIIIAVNALYLSLNLLVDISLLTYCIAACFMYYFTMDYAPKDLIVRSKGYIVDIMTNPVIMFDYEKRLVMANNSVKEITLVYDAISLEDYIDSNNIVGIDDINKDCVFEYKMTSGGINRWYKVTYRCLHDNSARYIGILMVWDDITSLKEATIKIEYNATHDMLTGLYNRYYINEYVKHDRIREMTPAVFALININALKLINDFYNNSMGDSVLTHVSGIVNRKVREGDIVARLDGDEILVIMPHTVLEESEKVLAEIKEEVACSPYKTVKISIEYGSDILSEGTEYENVLLRARNTMSQRKMMNKDSARSSIVESLKRSLQESDYDTEEHAERTKDMAMKLGEKMGLKNSELGELGLLAILHDIGKISIPDSILLKPGKLTDEEWEIMKSHTTKGYEIAKITPELSNIAKYILHHHERWDGRGYPYGLAGEDIPVLSRIITVVDSHDVMTHDRPYHKAMTMSESVEELRRNKNTQFDANIVDTFIELLRDEGMYDGD